MNKEQYMVYKGYTESVVGLLLKSYPYIYRYKEDLIADGIEYLLLHIDEHNPTKLSMKRWTSLILHNYLRKRITRYYNKNIFNSVPLFDKHIGYNTLDAIDVIECINKFTYFDKAVFLYSVIYRAKSERQFTNSFGVYVPQKILDTTIKSIHELLYV